MLLRTRTGVVFSFGQAPKKLFPDSSSAPHGKFTIRFMFLKCMAEKGLATNFPSI
jgi:hypothetical protein